MIIRSRWRFEFEDEKGSKTSCIFIPSIFARKSRYKTNPITMIYSGVARVTQYGLLLKISQKSVAGDTIDGMHLHIS